MLHLATSRPAHLAMRRCLHWAKAARAVSSSICSGSVLNMPALSPTMQEGTIQKWLVRPGESVESGDSLAEVETENAWMEWEACDDGHVLMLLAEEGKRVKVGAPVALILPDDTQYKYSCDTAEGEMGAMAAKVRKLEDALKTLKLEAERGGALH